MCSESQKMMAVKLIFWNKRIIDFEDRDVKTRLFIENKLDAFLENVIVINLWFDIFIKIVLKRETSFLTRFFCYKIFIISLK